VGEPVREVALRFLTVVAIAMLAVACSVPKPSWREVRSQHFVLHTDVPLSHAEDIVRDFERAYAVVRSCVRPGGTDPPGISEVVAFGDESDYRKIALAQDAAYFAYGSNLIESKRRIVFPVYSKTLTVSRQEIFQHELTHRFVAHYMPNVPLWFNEGMAEFLSTARLDDQSVIMGEPPMEHWLSGSGWMVDRQPLLRVAPDPAGLRSTRSERLNGSGYIGAWMMVHVMVLGEPRHRQALEGYLHDLRSGRLSEAEVLATHFDQKMLSEVDAAYMAFQTRTSTQTQAIALDAPPTLGLVSRSVPDAEALAIRGRLWRRDARMLALQDANRAISVDAKSPEGYLLRANLLLDAGNRPAAARDLRTALRLAPEDQRVRRGLGAVLLFVDGPTTEVKELVEWVRQRATTAPDFRLLASWELKTKHPDRALEFAKRGVSLDISCVSCYELAAEASFRSSDREAAVRWQRQAVNVAADHTHPTMLERLARYEKAPVPTKKALKHDDPIHAAIRARRPEFDACYDAALAKNSTLRGKVTILFVVGVDGSVTDASDGGSELKDPELTGCVAGVLRTMKFDPPANGARTFRHWFRFPKKTGGAQEK
jgi:tetratricopeptide (TPR) repeat protein